MRTRARRPCFKSHHSFSTARDPRLTFALTFTWPASTPSTHWPFFPAIRAPSPFREPRSSSLRAWRRAVARRRPRVTTNVSPRCTVPPPPRAIRLDINLPPPPSPASCSPSRRAPCLPGDELLAPTPSSPPRLLAAPPPPLHSLALRERPRALASSSNSPRNSAPPTRRRSRRPPSGDRDHPVPVPAVVTAHREDVRTVASGRPPRRRTAWVGWRAAPFPGRRPPSPPTGSTADRSSSIVARRRPASSRRLRTARPSCRCRRSPGLGIAREDGPKPGGGLGERPSPSCPRGSAGAARRVRPGATAAERSGSRPPDDSTGARGVGREFAPIARAMSVGEVVDDVHRGAHAPGAARRRPEASSRDVRSPGRDGVPPAPSADARALRALHEAHVLRAEISKSRPILCA